MSRQTKNEITTSKKWFGAELELFECISAVVSIVRLTVTIEVQTFELSLGYKNLWRGAILGYVIAQR
jgi:hypothetical protein